MIYSISIIKDILKGEYWFNETAAASDAVIEHLLIDSRKISFPQTSLFFAIVGERHDGHDFIEDAYKSGVRNFVVSHIENIDNQYFKEAIFIKVPNVLRDLQDLAAYHRAQFPQLQVIGITGSNGKTIVKEWLYQLLKDDFNIVRSPKSYNSQVGVPLSVWQINETHDLAIFEAGISTTGEMAYLERIIQPTIGVFTNLGAAHTEGFASDEEKIKEKFKLFKNVKTLICRQDELLRFPKIKIKGKILNWSKTTQSDAQLVDIQHFKSKAFFKLIYKNNTLNIEIPFTDSASIDNATTCILTLLVLKKDLFSHQNILKVFAEKLSRLEPIAMRLEMKAGINGCLVVNDSYNSDFNALQIALDFMAQQSRQLKRTVVLSDILQSGQDADILYKKIADLLIEKGVSKLIVIGENVSKIKKFISQTIDCQYFTTTVDFLKSVNNADFQNQIILLKGARQFEFERIAERLSQKSHKTVLEINLNALTHNLFFFKSLLQPKGSLTKPKIMAMVKASAYGNGSDEVARLLEFHKVDYLAVAYSDEGIALRNAGVKLPIMVMNPEEESFDALIRFDLEPEIYSLNILKQFINFIENEENTEGVLPLKNSTTKSFKIHLKLDTGMHRLGFESIDIQEVIQIWRANKSIHIASIFTHLAASEAAEHDHFTDEQVSRFMEMYNQISDEIKYKPMRHVLNSSGITRHPNYHFEMVRLGIGLYGIDSNGAFQNQLQVVQTLKASISQIKNVPQIETVGYSRRGVLLRDSRIATISIGYADGLLRGAGNGQFSVYLHGQRAPIIGSVCMDMTMIDVTDILEATEGDDVEIFGSHLPVQALAKVLNTIPYEIFTGISERVKRVYFQE